ncbi:MAG: Xaa-Pro aminopeptidase [uncultured Rubrobacteraceae bacterium]|uniref:Xaa-Pro aminopeptidase n=1 Tax=uncultured Rubrobacteraceae bacterium TaxID=349277 RepID=A0A6J4QH73_9ACTN|nr:MAG: Xaa-Pro aminopeptidase [uncultured Rubrobacteraceae bacterium]
MSSEDRRQRLLETADRLGLGAVLLGLPANFAHYTGGSDNRVDHSQPLGVAAVLVTSEAEYVVADNIEAPRMREEETPGFEVVEHPWYEDPAPLLRELSGGASLGADFSLEGIRGVSEEIAPLRYVLDEDAVKIYRRAGTETSAAMGEAAGSVSRGMTEHEAAANLVAACRRRGLTTSVVLVAADDRIARYRHPIPRGATVERRVMLVVCAERGGLYVSLTRIVHLEEPDEDFRRRQGACEEILRRLREEGTRPGRTLAGAFEDCKGFYAEAGYPDEWRLHHQGGIAGYASREIIASPGTRQEIEVGQAFAWNPSITGAKAEETFVLTENGPEVLTDP